MTAGYIIRKAELGDREALTRLCMLSKQSNGYDDAFMAQCADELRVRDSWIVDDGFWLAATPDGELCGCIRLIADPDDTAGEVGTCFVHPDWQGRGVGKALFAQLLEAAGECGMTSLGLDSDPDAEPFYENIGFRTVGRSPSGSIPGRFLPRMELNLKTVQSGARG